MTNTKHSIIGFQKIQRTDFDAGQKGLVLAPGLLELQRDLYTHLSDGREYAVKYLPPYEEVQGTALRYTQAVQIYLVRWKDCEIGECCTNSDELEIEAIKDSEVRLNELTLNLKYEGIHTKEYLPCTLERLKDGSGWKRIA